MQTRPGLLWYWHALASQLLQDALAQALVQVYMGWGGKGKCCAGSASTVFSGSEFSCECGRRDFFDATPIPLLVFVHAKPKKPFWGLTHPCVVAFNVTVCFEFLCIGTFLSVVVFECLCLPLAGFG